MRDAGLQDAVDRFAAAIGMPIVLEDADQQLIAYSPHLGPTDAMRQDSILKRATSAAIIDYFRRFDLPGRTEAFLIDADPSLGVLARYCVPLRVGSDLIGFAWALAASGVVDDEQVAAAHTAAPALAAQLRTHREEQHRGSAALIALIDDSAERRAAAAAELGARPGLAGRARFAVVVCRGDDWHVPAVRRSFWNTPLTRDGSPHLRALGKDGGVALVGVEDLGAAERAAIGGALIAIRRAGGGEVLLGGVGGTVATLADVHLSHVQALRACRVATLPGHTNGVAFWDLLGADRFLTQFGDEELAAAVDPRVEALIATDPSLGETLEAILDAAGSIKVVAEALHVHRATLYQRIERIERIGIDLRDGSMRLAAHMSLRALRLLGRWPPAAGGHSSPPEHASP